MNAYILNLLHKHIFALTFLSVAILSASKMNSIELPVWAMVLLALFAIVGWMWCCMAILQDLGGMKRIMADADEEGGMR